MEGRSNGKMKFWSWLGTIWMSAVRWQDLEKRSRRKSRIAGPFPSMIRDENRTVDPNNLAVSGNNLERRSSGWNFRLTGKEPFDWKDYRVALSLWAVAFLMPVIYHIRQKDSRQILRQQEKIIAIRIGQVYNMFENKKDGSLYDRLRGRYDLRPRTWFG